MNRAFSVIRFSGFELDPDARRLVGRDGIIELERKPFDLLVLLTAQPGRAFSREELLEAVWPGQVVLDDAVTQAITRLRKALGSEADSIETVRGFGYRFVADVEPVPAPADATLTTAPPRPWTLMFGTFGVLCLLVLVLMAFPRNPLEAEGRRVAVLPFESSADAEEWIHLGLSSLMADALPAHHRIEIIPPGRSRRFADAGGTAGDRLRLATGATHVLSARVRREETRWILDYRLQNADGGLESGEVAHRSLRGLTERLTLAVAGHLAAKRRASLAPLPMSDSDFVNQAFARGRHAQYEGDFRRAAELFQLVLSEDPLLHAARYRLAEAQRRLGHYDLAWESAEAARRGAIDSGDAGIAGEALTTLGLIAWRQGDHEQAVQWVTRALEVHRAERNHAAEVHARNVLAIIIGRRGRETEAKEHYLKALATATAHGDRAGEAKTLNNLGWHAGNQGRYRESYEYAADALAIQRDLGLKSGMALSLNNMGANAHYLGRIEEATHCYERALEIRREIGDRAGVVTTLGNLGTLSAERGRLQQAQRLVEEAVGRADVLGSPELLAHAVVKLGDVSLQASRYADATAAFDRAESLWRELGVNRGLRELRLWRIEVEFARGRLAPAEAMLTEIETEEPSLTAWSMHLAGRLALSRDDPVGALNRFDEAIEAARHAGDPISAIDAALDAAHACMDLRQDCATEYLVTTAGWRDEYAPAALAHGRWLMLRGEPGLARSALEHSRSLAGDHWSPRAAQWLASTREVVD